MSTETHEYDRWLAALTASEVADLFAAQGCTEVLVKPMAARQDNDKNQIYVGPDLNRVGKIPTGDVEASSTKSRKPGAAGETKFTAPVDFVWLAPDGPSPAPQAKLIYYPQYPEVRLSGLLYGSPNPPRSLYSRSLRGQEPDRHLLIGIRPDDTRVWALILPPEAVSLPFITELTLEPYGAFKIWSLEHSGERAGLDLLLDRLGEIQEMGWIPGQRISQGTIVPYKARNAGGYTLEALLGVSPNGLAEPDFEGWELKALATNNLLMPGRGAVTLMTPEPTGGLYRDNVFNFMRTYGYPSPTQPNRYDFTGRHFVGRELLPKTGTKLEIHGWDGDRGVHPEGAIALLDAEGRIAASWSFAGLIAHWKRKHFRCCYVSYEKRDTANGTEYRFGPIVRLCEGTTFLRLLGGFADQAVYYDPGVKMTRESETGDWKVKKRSQFRVAYQNVERLYAQVSDIDTRNLDSDPVLAARKSEHTPTLPESALSRSDRYLF